MGYKICSNIPCLSRRCYGKYWRRPSLLINLFNITHLKNWTDVFEIPYNSNIRKLWIKCLTVFYLALWIWGQSNNMFYGLSAFFNQLAPVNFIFLYFPAEIHEFSFAPRCKMDGHRGTCTWCFKINSSIIQASLILNNYLTSRHYIEKDSDTDLVILRCRKPDYSSKENTCARDS